LAPVTILCPVAGDAADSRSARSLLRCGQPVTFEDVGRHPAAYPELLAKYWAAGDDLVVCEHDVVAPSLALDMFSICEEPWCYHGYVDHNNEADTWPPLGLARFRGELLRATPECWNTYRSRRLGPINPDTGRPDARTIDDYDPDLPPPQSDPPWLHCDEWVAAYIRKTTGVEPHRHYPDVVNL